MNKSETPSAPGRKEQILKRFNGLEEVINRKLGDRAEELRKLLKKLESLSEFAEDLEEILTKLADSIENNDEIGSEIGMAELEAWHENDEYESRLEQELLQIVEVNREDEANVLELDELELHELEEEGLYEEDEEWYNPTEDEEPWL